MILDYISTITAAKMVAKASSGPAKLCVKLFRINRTSDSKFCHRISQSWALALSEVLMSLFHGADASDRAGQAGICTSRHFSPSSESARREQPLSFTEINSNLAERPQPLLHTLNPDLTLLPSLDITISSPPPAPFLLYPLWHPHPFY